MIRLSNLCRTLEESFVSSFFSKLSDEFEPAENNWEVSDDFQFKKDSDRLEGWSAKQLASIIATKIDIQPNKANNYKSRARLK